MRIALINTIAGKTATGSIVDSIAEAVIAQGGEALIASGRGSSTIENATSVRIGNRYDHAYHALMTRIADRHALHSATATKSFIKRLKQWQPDVVHLHNLHGYYLHLPSLLTELNSARIPIVITLHDLWSLTGHCALPSVVNCRKFLDASCSRCPMTRSYPRSLYDGSARNMRIKKELFEGLRNVNLVAVSDWLRDEISASWLGDKPLTMIANGIDTSAFAPMPNIKRQRRVIAVANVWTSEKGVDDLALLRSLLPRDITIAVAGHVAEKVRKSIDGIQWLGYLPAERLREQYCSAAVAVSLSRCESWGMAIAEAMSTGTPVAAYDNTALSDSALRRLGCLVPDGDIAAIAAMIMKRIDNPDATIGEECRAHAVANFGKKRMTDSYISLYHNIIDNDFDNI